MSALIT